MAFKNASSVYSLSNSSTILYCCYNGFIALGFTWRARNPGYFFSDYFISKIRVDISSILLTAMIFYLLFYSWNKYFFPKPVKFLDFFPFFPVKNIIICRQSYYLHYVSKLTYFYKA